MNKREYKGQLYRLFDLEVDNLDFLGRMNLINKILLDYQKENEDKRDTSNKGRNGRMSN